jgi:hypothetical protein
MVHDRDTTSLIAELVRHIGKSWASFKQCDAMGVKASRLGVVCSLENVNVDKGSSFGYKITHDD